MFTFLKKLVRRYKSKILNDPNVPAYIPHILNTLENLDESNLLSMLASFGGVFGGGVWVGGFVWDSGKFGGWGGDGAGAGGGVLDGVEQGD